LGDSGWDVVSLTWGPDLGCQELDFVLIVVEKKKQKGERMSSRADDSCRKSSHRPGFSDRGKKRRVVQRYAVH